jgi:hypothetical protein
MKQINTAALIIMCMALGAHSQEKLLDVLPVQDKKVIYEGVVIVDSASKSELQRRAKRWFIEAYKSPKDVISLDEPDEIMGKGIIKTSHQAGFMTIFQIDLQHTIDLQFKDGKYRYQIRDFRTQYEVQIQPSTPPKKIDIPLEEWASGSRKENTKKYLTKVDQEVQSLIKSIETALKAPTSTKKDW